MINQSPTNDKRLDVKTRQSTSHYKYYNSENRIQTCSTFHLLFLNNSSFVYFAMFVQLVLMTRVSHIILQHYMFEEKQLV